MSIRTGIVGLQSFYWPNAFANCLQEISEAEFVACADMDYDPNLIKISLGKTPEEYAAQYNVKLYHDPVEMIEKEDLQAVCVCAKHTEIVDFVELVAPLGVDIYIAKPTRAGVFPLMKWNSLAQKENPETEVFAVCDIVRERAESLARANYAEAEYVHDCRSLMKDENGLTWRASLPPIQYCTHSLGPLLFAMDDYCVSTVGFNTGCNVSTELGAIDMEVGLFRTAKDATIKILCGFSVVRKPAFHWYVMYGTKGSVESTRNHGNNAKKYLIDEQPDKMTEYPLDKAGHGSAEYRMIEDFIKSVINDTNPPIDVYKAMDYTAPGICAHISAESNGKLIKVPNYR